MKTLYKRMGWDDDGHESQKRLEHGAEPAERASTRGNGNYNAGHAHDPQSGIYIHVNQTQKNQTPTPQNASTVQSLPRVSSPSQHISQSSEAPSMQSRLTHPWSADSFTVVDQSHLSSRQADRTQSCSRSSQVPPELPATSSRRAEESHETRPRSPTIQHDSRPYEEAPSSRTSSRQSKHTPAPSKHVHFACSPESESSTLEERLEQAVENARQSSRPYERGSRQLQRERSPYSARRSGSRQSDAHAPASRSENVDGTRRYRRSTWDDV